MKDEFETVDGSRPKFIGLSEASGHTWPLAAFALLEGGDVFESTRRPPKPSGQKAALKAAQAVRVQPHGASQALVDRVVHDIVLQLEGNEALGQRLLLARPLEIELLPGAGHWRRRGYPASVSPQTSGLFWDDPSWPCARLALRQDRLGVEPHLVFHEMAHALAFLVFSPSERALLIRRFLPTYRAETWVDEAFAIYSEREFISQYQPEDMRAPGIYGHARKRWSKDHLLTRFVRHLYRPDQPFE